MIVAVEPNQEDGLLEAVRDGGADIGEVTDAQALVWTDPSDPNALGEMLGGTNVSWVQLPFAGIESFFDEGVIDEDHTWTCTKGVYGPACAEHALALMLAGSRRLQVHSRARSWVASKHGDPERRLAGSTVVIVGTGGIGTALGGLLTPLNVRCIGVNRSGNPMRGADETIISERLDEALGEADYVVIAASLTPQTRGMFSTAQFQAMKPDAWLVNVARGGLVDTDALVRCLRAGSIAGAALDVTDPEPLPDGHPLWDLENAFITPHIANTWDMALPELRGMVKRNVEHFAASERLEGLVDPLLGY